MNTKKIGKILFIFLLLMGCNSTPAIEVIEWPDSDPDKKDSDSSISNDTSSEIKNDSESSTPVDTGPALGPAINMDCSGCTKTGDSPENMLCSIDLCDTDVVLENDIIAVTPFDLDCDIKDVYEAVTRFGSSSNALEPKLNGSYALFATGHVEGDMMKTHNSRCMDDDEGSSTMTDPWDTDSIIYDVAEWKIKMTAPEEAEAFSFKYVFFSAEFDDFISSPYNDKFYVVLESPITTGGRPWIINYTDCRDPGKYYDFKGDACDTPSGFCCYIAINSALSDCCWYPQGSPHVTNSQSLTACPGDPVSDNTNITGTGFECATSAQNDFSTHGSSTGWLQTAWPITPGEEFTLTFHIHDVSDAKYDSQVIIDSFTFHKDITGQGTISID